MKVIFSRHASQRMVERLNVKIDTKIEIDISKKFVKAKTYKHNVSGKNTEAWVLPGQTVVLIIDSLSKIVLTILHNDAPFVRECYQAIVAK